MLDDTKVNSTFKFHLPYLAMSFVSGDQKKPKGGENANAWSSVCQQIYLHDNCVFESFEFRSRLQQLVPQCRSNDSRVNNNRMASKFTLLLLYTGGRNLDYTCVITPLFLNRLDSLNIETFLLDKRLHSDAPFVKYIAPDVGANCAKEGTEGQRNRVFTALVDSNWRPTMALECTKEVKVTWACAWWVGRTRGTTWDFFCAINCAVDCAKWARKSRVAGLESLLWCSPKGWGRRRTNAPSKVREKIIAVWWKLRQKITVGTIAFCKQMEAWHLVWAPLYIYIAVYCMVIDVLYVCTHVGVNWRLLSGWIFIFSFIYPHCTYSSLPTASFLNYSYSKLCFQFRLRGSIRSYEGKYNADDSLSARNKKW